MKEQIAIQHLLNETLMNLRIKNSNYSLRAFAKKLDISPSALSEILKGKRKVSKQLAERMTNRLHLSPMEKASVLDKFPEKMRRNSKGKPSNLENDAYLKMTGNQFAVISESIHLAILSLVKTENYQSDITWMSKRLSVSENEVRKALFRLLEMELIIFENGEFDVSNTISTIEGNGWAGELFDIIGPATINSVSIYNSNNIDTTISIVWLLIRFLSGLFFNGTPYRLYNL